MGFSLIVLGIGGESISWITLLSAFHFNQYFAVFFWSPYILIKHCFILPITLLICILYDSFCSWIYFRLMLGLAGVPALIQLVGFLFLPESPRWLVENGKHEEGKRVLLKIHGPSMYTAEYEAIDKSAEREREEKEGGNMKWWVYQLDNDLLISQLVQMHHFWWHRLFVIYQVYYFAESFFMKKTS